jgi:hypothetical protein
VRRFLTGSVRWLGALVVLAITGWGTLALAVVGPGGDTGRLGSLPFSWKVLLSGYTPGNVYESGRMDRSLPFEELKRRSLVNASAQAADQAPDFSRRIRAGLPGVAGR